MILFVKLPQHFNRFRTNVPVSRPGEKKPQIDPPKKVHI